MSAGVLSDHVPSYDSSDESVIRTSNTFIFDCLHHLADSVLHLYSGQETGENKSWTTDFLHLVVKELLEFMDREAGPKVTRATSTICIHGYPIRIRTRHNAPVSDMAALSSSRCPFPLVRLFLVNLERRELLCTNISSSRLFQGRA